MNRKIVNPIIKDTATFIKTAAESEKEVSEIEITLLTGGGYFKNFIRPGIRRTNK